MNAWSVLKRSLGQFRTNPLRTILTLLGVVFGVGSVVAMMSIGEGAQQEILAQIEAMGATSVHINAKSAAKGEISKLAKLSGGLSREDVEHIRRVLPEVQRISYRRTHDLSVTDLELTPSSLNVWGVNAALFDVHALRVEKGRALHPLDLRDYRRVVVIGPDVAAAMSGDPIGQFVRLDYAYVRVVGVLARGKAASGGGEDQLAVSTEYDRAVLLPYSTLTQEFSPEPAYHSLDVISVEMESTGQTLEAKHVLGRLLKQLHGGMEDVEIVAPEEVLRQKQSTQAIFNAVLLAIAAISLLVGGIGVMNIMLANIMERIGEIGLRRAIGATKRDIRNQFLLESMIICTVGGVIGVAFGLGASAVVGEVAGLSVGFAWESVLLSFGISLLVGMVFGIMPAVRAANVNPIDALRDG